MPRLFLSDRGEVTEQTPLWLKLLRHVLHGCAYVSFLPDRGEMRL